MEPRNPDTEMPDPRMLSEKLEDEGNAPKVDKPDSMTNDKEDGISDDDVEKTKESVGSVEELITELNRFEIRTLEDIQRIRKAVCEFGSK